MITGLPEDWGKQRLQSWRAQTQDSRHQDQEKGTVTPLRLNHIYLLVLEGLLWSHGSAGLTTGMGALAAAVLKMALGMSPLGDHHYLYRGAHRPKGWFPQAKKIPGREHNSTHQKITGLKLYPARTCRPEQDPVFPTASPSHQEAYTSLLASSIRTQDRRSNKNHNPTARTKATLQKVSQDDKAKGYIPDEGTR